MSRLLARFWNQVGMMQRFIGLRSGRRDAFESAEASFSRALVAEPEFFPARYNRGLLYWRELNQPVQAIDDFTAVLEQQPEALFMRGMAYIAVGDYRASLEDLRAYIEQYPESRSYRNAYSQLRSLEAIVEELPPQLPNPSGEGDSTSSGRRSLTS